MSQESSDSINNGDDDNNNDKITFHLHLQQNQSQDKLQPDH